MVQQGSSSLVHQLAWTIQRKPSLVLPNSWSMGWQNRYSRPSLPISHLIWYWGDKYSVPSCLSSAGSLCVRQEARSIPYATDPLSSSNHMSRGNGCDCWAWEMVPHVDREPNGQDHMCPMLRTHICILLYLRLYSSWLGKSSIVWWGVQLLLLRSWVLFPPQCAYFASFGDSSTRTYSGFHKKYLWWLRVVTHGKTHQNRVPKIY